MDWSHLPVVADVDSLNEAFLNRYLKDRIDWSRDIDVTSLSKKLDGWSGSDIRLLCKEIAMHPVRRCLTSLEDGTYTHSIDPRKDQALEPISSGDISQGLERVHRAPLTCEIEKYLEWNRAFGST